MDPLDQTTPTPRYVDLAAEIRHRCEVRGTFTLRSGATTSYYFDKYQFASDPEFLQRICAALAPRVPSGTESIAGLEMGGIPIAVGLSMVTGIPTAFIRKEA